jgi:hypothetical protein
VNSLDSVVAIAAGKYFSLFLKSDGTVWACGINDAGQLGVGNLLNSNVPLKMVGLTNVIAISAGEFHSLFLKNNGTVWACGGNFNGQFGNGTNTDSNIPVQVSSLSNIIEIAAGFSHSMFKQNDSTVWGSGANGYGQLGNLSNTSTNAPVAVYDLCHLSVGIDDVDIEDFEVVVYPKPSNGIIYMKSSPDLIGSELIIVNSYGEEIYVSQINSEDTVIDLKQKSNGVYFYRVINKEKLRTSGKILIQ